MVCALEVPTNKASHARLSDPYYEHHKYTKPHDLPVSCHWHCCRAGCAPPCVLWHRTQSTWHLRRLGRGHKSEDPPAHGTHSICRPKPQSISDRQTCPASCEGMMQKVHRISRGTRFLNIAPGPRVCFCRAMNIAGYELTRSPIQAAAAISPTTVPPTNTSCRGATVACSCLLLRRAACRPFRCSGASHSSR